MTDVVAVVTDLFFQARINAAARAAERSVRFLSPDQVPGDLEPSQLILVDLDARGNVLAAIRRAASQDATIVAFGPHVDTERRKAAKGAGAGRVLAKSKFVTELPRIMSGSRDEGAGTQS